MTIDRAWIGGSRRGMVVRGVLLAAALFASGCDERSPLAIVLEDQRIQLDAIGPGPTVPVSVEHRKSALQKVVAALRSKVSDGTKAETAAAWSMIGQAELGLAEYPAGEAAEADRRVHDEIRVARAALSQWNTLASVEASAARFSPQAELDELAIQGKSIDARIATMREEKARIDTAIADLRASVAGKTAQSKGLRSQASELKQQALNATAQQGLGLIQDAANIERQADALEVEASGMSALAAQAEPQAAEIDATIATLQNQRAILETAKQDVNERAASATRTRTDAQVACDAAASDVEALVRGIRQLRDETLTPKFEEAVSAYGKASSSAKSAMGEARTPAQLVIGSANQAIGDLQWSRARTSAAVSELMSDLASSRLPNASSYASDAAAAKADAETALSSATEAYQAAKSAFEGSGARDANVKRKIEQVGEALAKAVLITSNNTIDLRAQAEPSGESVGDDDGSDTAVASGPAATIDTVLGLVKSGQFAPIIDHLHVEDQANRAVLAGVAELASAGMELNSAYTAKFGKSMLEEAGSAAALGGGGMNGGMPGMSPEALASVLSDLNTLSSADFQITVEGDRATAIGPANDDGTPAEPLLMRNIDGRWLIDLSQAEEEMSAMTQDVDKWRELVLYALPLVTQALKDMANETGTFDTPEVFQNAMRLKMQPLMFPIMGKMQELGLEMPGTGGGPGGG